MRTLILSQRGSAQHLAKGGVYTTCDEKGGRLIIQFTLLTLPMVLLITYVDFISHVWDEIWGDEERKKRTITRLCNFFHLLPHLPPSSFASIFSQKTLHTKTHATPLRGNVPIVNPSHSPQDRDARGVPEFGEFVDI